MTRRIALLVPALALPLSCGASSDKEPEPSIAKALSHVVEGQEKMKAHADDEAVKKMREKAAEEAARAQQEAFDALVLVPEDAPANLGELCEATAAAFDAFKTSRLAGNDVALGRWNATKEPDLEKLVSTCKAEKNKKVWGCKWNALSKAPPTFGEAAAEKFLVACEDKWKDAK